MIETIRELARFLSGDVTVDEVIARIGPVIEDPGFLDQPLVLQSNIEGARTVKLARNPESGLPYVLTLRLDSPLTVAELQQAFGEYRRGRTHMEAPQEYLFDVDEVVLSARGEEDAIDTIALICSRA
ncbi:MAG: hypothetical protein ACLGH0_11850 [Thermoanaerobaculia bacterium]